MSDVNTVTGGENFYISTTKEKEDAERNTKSDRVTQDEFLKLLTTQLTHQDPLNPIKDQDFTAQLAQLQALDSQVDMTEALVALRNENQLQGASALIGKHITGVDKDGNDAEGTVRSAIVRDGQALLELENHQRVPFENVSDVLEQNAIQSAESSLTEASNMLGGWVKGTGESGLPVEGVVSSVVMQNNMPMLQLDTGELIQIKNLREVALAESVGAP